MQTLMNYEWRGNVRELENALTRGVTLVRGDVLLAEYLPLTSSRPGGRLTKELMSLKDMEKQYIDHVLRYTRWNKSRASEILGITRPTLDKKIKDYELADPRKAEAEQPL